MNELQKLNAQLAAIRKGQAELASKLSELGAERFEIESASNDRAASIEVAEQNLIEELARQELGEQSDVASAQQRLDEARQQAAKGIEPTQRLRVLDTLKTRFEGEHTALHEKGLTIIAAIKQAEADALEVLAAELHNDAESALEALTQAEPRLNAIRVLLAEYGRTWSLPILNEAQVRARFNITPADARRQILAKLAA